MLKFPSYKVRLILLLLPVALLGNGCAIQRTVDSKVYRVASVNGTNYYRVRILSSAVNGKAYFKAGLYPAYAVDMFRGQEADLPTEMIDAENQMRRMVIAAQTNALGNYLNPGSGSNQTNTTEKLVQAQEIVLGKGGRTVGEFSTLAMQFNPVKTLVDYTANKKFVIALSSDPDEILNQISAFVEEAKTNEAIQDAVNSQLGGVAAPEATRAAFRNRRVKSLIASLEAEAARTDVKSAASIAQLIARLNAGLETLK